MNKFRFYTILSGITFLLSLIFFAWYNELIILTIPSLYSLEIPIVETIQKKQVSLCYFDADRWKIEKQDLLWSIDTQKNILNLANAWFAFLEEERILSKKITVQTVLMDKGKCAYLSFDRALFNKEDTIFKKWMLIEGLLKTIISNDITLYQVQFLVQHKPLSDAHLDFSSPWPVHGFIK